MALSRQQHESDEIAQGIPRASVRARILVVMPPLDLPMAWL
jgi:hypothetical protein